jgi:hypothetical protein
MVRGDLTPSRRWNDEKSVVPWEICFEKSCFLTTCCNYTNNAWHCGASVVVFTCENLLPHIWGSMASLVPLVAQEAKEELVLQDLIVTIVTYEKYWKTTWDLWISILFCHLEEVVNVVKTVDCNGSTKLHVTPKTMRINMMHDLCQRLHAS